MMRSMQPKCHPVRPKLVFSRHTLRRATLNFLVLIWVAVLAVILGVALNYGLDYWMHLSPADRRLLFLGWLLG